MPRPEWNIFNVYDDYEEEYDGEINLETLRHIRFEVKLPLLVTGTKIDVQVKSGDFILKAASLYLLMLKFPIRIDPTSASGYFNTKERVLFIIVRVNSTHLS